MLAAILALGASIPADAPGRQVCYVIAERRPYTVYGVFTFCLYHESLKYDI